MVHHVEALLDALEMPFRILNLCAGDLGFAAGITYDFEIWSPGQSRWLEVALYLILEHFRQTAFVLDTATKTIIRLSPIH